MLPWSYWDKDDDPICMYHKIQYPIVNVIMLSYGNFCDECLLSVTISLFYIQLGINKSCL